MATKAEREELAFIALEEVGVQEEGGNNCGPRVRMYQAATWLKPAAWPWCAAFVDWCVMMWLPLLPEASPETKKGWRPQTAGAVGLERWAKSKGLKVLKRDAAVESGDIVVFDMSHCGIAVSDCAKGAPIKTVEGNTGSAGKRDSETGDGVWKKTRDRALVRSIIRLERAA